MKSVKRICLLGLAATFVLLLGCGLLSPLLLQSIGERVAGQFGISWQASSANGFASLNLEQVEVKREGLHVRIDTLRLPQPGPWLLSRAGLRRPPKVLAGTVEIHVIESGGQASSAPVGPEILETIRAGILEAQPWLPDVEINRLEVVTTGPDPILAANAMRFTGRALAADVEPVGRLPSLNIRCWLTDSTIRLTAVGKNNDESLRLVLALETGPPGGVIRGRLVSADVPLQFAAMLENERWRPATVSLEAAAWPVPLFLIPEESQIHGSPRLDLDARFSGDSFRGDLRLNSPETGPRREAATADIRLAGNTDWIEVSRLVIESDWLKADLSQPVRYSIRENTFSGEARFLAQVELDKQPWIPAKGRVEVDVEFEPDTEDLPDLEFTVTGSDLQIAGQTVQSLSLNGLLDYPRLSLEEFVAGLPSESEIRGAVGVQLDSREIDGNLSYHLSPEWLGSLAPEFGLASMLSGVAQFEGDPADLKHSGQIEPINLEVAGVYPLVLSLEWAGRGTHAIDLLADLESDPGGGVNLVAEVEATGKSTGRTIRIAEAGLRRAGVPVLALQQPVTIQLDTAAPIPVIGVSEFTLQGSSGSISGFLDHVKQAVSMEVHQLESGFLNDWLVRSIPPFVVDSGSISLDQLNPFLAGSIAFQAHTASEQLELLSLAVKGAFTDSGIEIESLEGLVEDTPFVRGSLGLPIRVFPLGSESGKRVQINPDGFLKGSLSSEISRELLEDFPEIPYLDRLAGTQIDVELGGTVDQPSGEVDVYLAVLPGVLIDPRLQGYQFEDLTVSARLEPDAIHLDALRGQLREAVIEAAGTLEPGPLIAFFNGSEPDWRKALRTADLAVSLQGFRADSFTSLLPGYLRPTGQLAADLAVEPGPHLSGKVRLEDFSLRPTLYTQTIDDINVILDLDGSRLSLDTASASVGGSVVKATGYVDVGNFQAPVYRLKIGGIRTPLVRTPDLLLHADVELVVDRSDAESPGSVTGTIRLRDSVLLMDIDPLAARTAGRSMAKPPFFRVPVEPFSEWELEIRVSGEDALRFRSQYAKALLSVNMSLDGTLGTPVLVGDIFSTDGQIQFPGTRMNFSRSELFVTREQQQTLQIDLNATGRTSSTIITMRVGGSVDEPHVEFSSTPALSNAQIFHLLATGSLERSGVGNIGLYLGKGLFGPGSADGSLLDRLSVEVGRDVSETGENTLDLYLDLTERLRLHGEYDKYDDQNLNLEWEVFTR